MAKIRFDKLIDNYLPTNKDFYHPENTQELSGDIKDTHIFIDSKINIGNKETPYKEYKFITESTDETNQKVFYLSMYGTDTTEPLTIVEDYTASNAKALKVLSGYAAVFQTPYPYNPQTLKKLVVRVKAIEKGDLRIGITGISNKAIIKPDGSIGYPTTTTDIDFYEIISTTGTDIGYNYVTLIGYFKGTTAEPLTDNSPFDGNIQSFPSYNPNVPYALRDGTTDVALAFKCLSGQYYIDSIEIQDVEADITSIPGGTTVVETITGVELKAEPPIIQYSTRANLLTKEILLTAELSNLSGSAVFTTTEGMLVDVVDEYENIVPNKKILKLNGDDTIVPPVLPVPYDNNTVNVTCTLDGYGSTISLYKSGGGLSEPYNFGLVNNTGSIPRTTLEGEPLISGDYFLWGGEHETIEDLALEDYLFQDDLKKGEIYEYSNDGWSISNNGNLVMTMFDDISVLLENNPDIDSQVMSNAVIGRLAVLEAFIKRLVTQDLEITNSGAIRQNYDKSGNIEDDTLPGFYLGSGQLKANDAELIGALRTGVDVPKGLARIAIKDRVGIISGPSFSGSGVNNLTVVSDGRLDEGEWEIKVTGAEEEVTGLLDANDIAFSSPQVNNSEQLLITTGDIWVKFINANNEYSFSIDSGETWSASKTLFSGYHIVDIECSGTTAIALITDGYPNYHYFISRSTDYGETWSALYALESDIDWYEVVGSGTTWMIIGVLHSNDNYITVRSTDNGVTWGNRNTSSALHFAKLAVSGTTWIIAGFNFTSGYVEAYRSTNNGLTFSGPITLTDDSFAVADIKTNGNTWVMCFPEAGTILRSTNDGASWNVVHSGGTGVLEFVSIANYNNVWVIVGASWPDGDYGVYIYSTDNGATWSNVLTIASYSLEVIVGNGNRWWAYGFDGDDSWEIHSPVTTLIATSKDGAELSPDIKLYPKRNITVATDTIIKFDSIIGHTVGDSWTFKKDRFHGLSVLDIKGSEYVKASGGKFSAKIFGYFSHEETATLTPATNQIAMSGIVSALGLEVGDVIQIIGGGDNDGRLHTAEYIEDDDSIVVNYEHCGGRGNGSLKLFDYSGNLIIKLIAKWWQAPLGLGQAWVDVTSNRSMSNDTVAWASTQKYANTTNRLLVTRAEVRDSTGNDVSIYFMTNGDYASNMSTKMGNPSTGMGVFGFASVGSEYAYQKYSNDTMTAWRELR